MARKGEKRAARTRYSMPEMSPLYGAPPYHYRDTEQMRIDFRTDPRVLRKLLPEPLVSDRDGNMFVAISKFFCSGFGGYHEILLAGLATYKRRPVNYGIYLVLDNDIAICGGREIWGFPKKLGKVTLGEKDGVVSGTVERGGLRLVEAAVQMAEYASPDELTGSPEYVSRKLIPSVSNALPPDVCQLTSTTLTDIVVREVHKGPATLRFGMSPADRMHEVPVREVLGGWYYRTDFTLGDGEVIHDYLR